MSDRTPFNDFSFQRAPDPFEFEEYKPRRRRWITAIFALIMIVALFGGSLYAALRPYLFPPSTDTFNATLTGVSAHENCDNAPLTTPRGLISSTRHLCVCGRTFTREESRVNFGLRLRNANGQTIKAETYNSQKTGVFCQEMSLDSRLRNGNYIVEILSTRWVQPVAWIRFSVFEGSNSAFSGTPLVAEHGSIQPRSE